MGLQKGEWHMTGNSQSSPAVHVSPEISFMYTEPYKFLANVLRSKRVFLSSIMMWFQLIHVIDKDLRPPFPEKHHSTPSIGNIWL